jgi:hypothetical protein
MKKREIKNLIAGAEFISTPHPHDNPLPSTERRESYLLV